MNTKPLLILRKAPWVLLVGVTILLAVGLLRQGSPVVAAPAAPGSIVDVTAPSTYYFNWSGYANAGTQVRVQVPSAYNPAAATPLVIALHDFNQTRLNAISDYSAAAEAKGWLLAAPEMHGEVNNGTNVGAQAMASRASEWDVLDTINYVKTIYNVDASRIYLVGFGMGGMTAEVFAGKWPHLVAGVVADSAPSNLINWEFYSRPGQPGDNPTLQTLIQSETGAFTPTSHTLVSVRRPYRYHFEYERRSPTNFASNLKYTPLLLLHPQNDTVVLLSEAQFMYQYMLFYDPTRVELVTYAGNHGTRYSDFANYSLTWLNQFTRTASFTPLHNTFQRDESGRHYWMGVQYSSDAVSVDPSTFALRTEAHWTSVSDATFDATGRTITVEAENSEPMTGSTTDYGAYPPTNLTVDLLFYLDQIGLPTSGTYVVERVNKDTGEYVSALATASVEWTFEIPAPELTGGATTEPVPTDRDIPTFSYKDPFTGKTLAATAAGEPYYPGSVTLSGRKAGLYTLQIKNGKLTSTRSIRVK